MPEPYRPSNGSEGDDFDRQWCDKCEHDMEYRKRLVAAYCCDILTDAMLFDIGDKPYPTGWVYDKEGKPYCTAFKKYKTEEEKEHELNANNRLKMESAGQLRMF